MRNSKKDFQKFNTRASAKARGKREIMKALEAAEIDYRGAKIKFSREGGAKTNLEATGVFSETGGGYGFVTPEWGGKDIFIPAENTYIALDGDLVNVSYRVYRTAYGEERTEGKIISVESPKLERIVGTVDRDYYRHGRRIVEKLYLTADSGRCHKKFFIINGDSSLIGQKVLAKIYRRKSGFFECEILECFGSSLSREANYSAILAEYGIECEFTPEELSAADEVASEPVCADGRVSFLDQVVFTIDSESAKDLDDAVSLSRTDDGYILGVHIADVSHYVREKTALDRCSFRRGNSVYFTDKVVPMLPQSLSNGACSLNPKEDKYTLSALITLSAQGDILKTEIVRSVIRSKIKGIYSEINEIFEGSASEELLCKYSECIPTLEKMRELYKILAQKAKRRGAMELDSDEAEIILSPEGRVLAIEKRTRGDSERLIEQFMLTANEAVAAALREKGIPCVYRTHSNPPEDKLENFITYAHNLGFDTKFISKEKASAKDLGALLDEAKERGISQAVSYAMLRAMAKAEYSVIPSGHFGLSLENYCHFTSPIRRLSDLVTHRIINEVLLGDASPEKYKGAAKRAAAAANDGELRAVGAERRIENLYKIIYMSDHLGEKFSGQISSVASFGIFVTLENTCEGLIPISELGGFFSFDEKNLSIRGAGQIFRIGDSVKITVEEADITSGRLRFGLAE